MATSTSMISLWMDQLPVADPLPPLSGDRHCDVAVVGGGYTGLWLAYYLKTLAPNLSVCVLEAHSCGYGASGRNGGWLMSALDGEVSMLSALDGERRDAVRTAIHSIVPEVEAVLERERIDCHYRRGGGIYAAARYPEQVQRQRDVLQAYRSVGYGEEDYRWLPPGALVERLNIREAQGGIYTPHIARVQPALLCRGLLVASRRKGVEVYEGTSVRELSQSALETDSGRVIAPVRVIATEGFSYSLRDLHRYVLPVQSRVIATEPLTTAQWDEIGLDDREVFEDASPLITYGQRTEDSRLIFGARGTYRFGGGPQSDFSADDVAFKLIHGLMVDCFPQLRGVSVTHRWGGTLGIGRSARPHAIYDPATGLATAGGYSGEGVGASNLMARTLADLILDRDSQLRAMPWAHRVPVREALRRWEPEPLRWLGYKAISLGQRWRESSCRRGGAQWEKRLSRDFSRLVDRLPT